LSLVEDPLLAIMAAAAPTNEQPLTPPADESSFQAVDNYSKMPDSPMADHCSMDELEAEQSDPELDVQTSHLVTHAKVYAIAEKYVCPRHPSLFPPICLIARPCTRGSFHLRPQML
jgi:hypothetical protein